MAANEKRSAEELEAYLQARQGGLRPPGVPALNQEDTDLADELLALAEAAHPEADFSARLEQDLRREVSRAPAVLAPGQGKRRPALLRRPPAYQRAAFSLAGALALVLVVFLILPLFQQERLPRLPVMASSQESFEEGVGGSLGSFVLQTSLPNTPDQAPVFRLPGSQTITVAEARRLAERFGVSGPVYEQQFPEASHSNSGAGPLIENDPLPRPVIYTVIEGPRSVRVSGRSATYEDGQGMRALETEPAPGLEEAAATAEAFLRSGGLLDFPYRLEQDPDSPRQVRFVQMIDRWPTLEAGASVLVAANGQVARAVYYPLDLERVGEYPIYSSERVWNGLLSGNPPGSGYSLGIEQPISGAPNAPAQLWGPVYRPGEWADLYGRVDVYRPAPGEKTDAVLHMGELRLAASDQDGQELSQRIASGVRVWGQVRLDEAGLLMLDVEGWEDAPAEILHSVIGSVQRQTGQALLLAEDGKQYLLPHAPDSLPDGEQVSAWGWETGRIQDCYPVLGWIHLESLSPEEDETVPVEEATPAPTPELPTDSEILRDYLLATRGYRLDPPFEPGQVLEGLVGQLQVTRLEAPDGNRLPLLMLAEAPLDNERGWEVVLAGPALESSQQQEALQAYDRLWLRVWGRYENKDYPAIRVERYEAALPGQGLQAWLGRLELATVEELEVGLLVTRQGERFVLASSVRQPGTISQSYQTVKDQQILVEGALRADSFGGYAVIEDLNTRWGGEVSQMADLEGYRVQMPELAVALPTGETEIPGIALVEQVELVYQIVRADNEMDIDSVQPVWRFAGHTDQGASFEFLLQAVESRYME